MLRNARRLMVPVLAMLAISASSAIADPCNGLQIGIHSVDAGGTNSFVQCFNAGQWGRITLVGNGGTDLDVYVYDSFGRLVSFDEGDSDRCVIQFYVDMTQSYRIVVLNRGSLTNEFAIRAD